MTAWTPNSNADSNKRSACVLCFEPMGSSRKFRKDQADYCLWCFELSRKTGFRVLGTA